jgi:hypothetical protein
MGVARARGDLASGCGSVSQASGRGFAMKRIPITDLHQLRNELNKYKKGVKFDIRQFNQVARLAWLGKIVMMPLDPTDPDTRSFLMYVDYPDAFVANFVHPDEDLVGRIFIVDAEQGQALAEIVEEGVRERAALYEALERRDFYFQKFFRPGPQGPAHSE